MIQTLKSIHDRCADEGECWIWQQGCAAKTCPSVRHGDRTVLVRRLVWSLKHETATRRGYFVIATCRNALCVAPGCARQLNPTEYMAWLQRGGRMNGLAHRAAVTASVRARKETKLTIEKAAAVVARIEAGEDRGVVAADFKITRSHANRVARGDLWKPQGFSVFNMAAAT